MRVSAVFVRYEFLDGQIKRRNFIVNSHWEHIGTLNYPMDLDKIGFIKNYSEMFKSIILSYGQWGCILHILILMDHKQGYGKNNGIRLIVVFFT
ncbi:hypothetical protein [Ligilactobacillus ruminis]|uniref:hypothetical protein n=1 Tax=Ligilactobacillus ruminis TaxID=1623 RepID=UPI0022E8892F|nr:hypothetical protein [Ligilactobacillus ruminis]